MGTTYAGDPPNCSLPAFGQLPQGALDVIFEIVFLNSNLLSIRKIIAKK